MRLCEIAECQSRHYVRGWCRAHYRKWQEYGDPLYTRELPPRTGVTRRCSGRCKSELDTSLFAKGQNICRECRRKYTINNYSAGKLCKTCGAAVSNNSQRLTCRACHAKNRRDTATERRYINAQGYAVLTSHYDHPNSTYRGEVLEHVMIMSKVLGRGLVKGENVHHINGVRDDNRPENLEVWSRSQPSGQRIPDKVQWAKELLSLYEPEALAQPMLTVVEDVA